jgi:hypothetical protein
MRTLDGLAYDFQQVGEYVYLTNDADFTVQARLAPYGTSSSAAVNVAAAANVVGDRVGYYVNSNQPLLINGTSAAVPVGGLTLPHGGTLLRSTSGYTVKWPTGEQLILEPRGSYLNITISVPDRTKPYRGLLGTWDGNANNDLVSRTGQTFTASITQTDLYGAYGDSWRVTPDESLFDYGSDQGTATFSDDTFPSHPLTAASLPTQQYNEAHAACTAAGVVGATEVADCVLDVAATTTSDATTIASVAQAAASTILPPPVLVVKPSGYSQDFEGLADGRWTSTNMRMMPALDQVESTIVLGPFASAEAVGLTLTGLPPHSSITVAFDTQVVGPWNGASFELSGDTNGISVVTTFSNLLASQSFPDQLGIASHAAQSGALVAGAVDLGDGSTPRAIYHHSYSFSHSVSGIQLTFVAPTLPAGAVWTIDNVFVVTSNVGDPWNPKCTSNGSPLDDHNACTIDSCNPSTGVVHTPRPAGTSCSDGNLCNGVETCDAGGSCQGIAPIVDDHNPCTADACDPRLGVTHTALALGSSCSDGNRCNGAETCNDSGQCLPGTPPDPALLPPDVTCDGVDDDCDGRADDDYVPSATHCGVGACAASGQLLCDHGFAHDTCTALFAAAHDTICDGIDDNCNGRVDEEYAPVCTGGGVTVCANGSVSTVGCDDANACTTDGCSNGVCTHSTACDDGNACTADSCDPVLGCGHVSNTGASCNDGSACTTGDACTSSGACQGAAIAVDDGNVCTDDACDASTGVRHTIVAGRSCNDGNSCTTGDACTSEGVCFGADPLNCSDGLFCNGLETCSPAGGCAPGQPPAVNDNLACTTDSCDEASDAIVHQPPAGQAVCGQACIPASTTATSTVSVTCSPSAPLGTVCNPTHNVAISVNCATKVSASYTAGAGHCAPLRIHFYVDGTQVALSGFVGAAVNTGTISLGTVGTGSHTIGFGGEIGPGGCGTQLSSWGGSASVTTSPSL